MNTIAGCAVQPAIQAASGRPRLDHRPARGTWAVFAALLLAGLGYTAYGIATDDADS